jgi:carbon-monoxide dehydrogenase medium subunit
MYDFEFQRPASLADAITALKSAEDGKLLAGGHTLIPTLKQRLARPSDLIDLSGIAELRGIKSEGGTITVGATTSHAEVTESDAVKSAIPALAELAGMIGDPQVRHCGTSGGSIANNDPAADYPVAGQEGVFRVPEMEAALSANFSPDAISGITVSDSNLNTDIHASAEYRAHLIGVMVGRAVTACG